MTTEKVSPPEMTPQQYLKERVERKIEGYRKRGYRYRWLYLSMTATATVSAAVVPVLLNSIDLTAKGATVMPTLLSLLVTILVGLEGVFHFREHWRNYDLIKSNLRQERYLYLSGSGVYKKKANAEEAFVTFVERVESEISKERAETIEMRTSAESEDEDNGS